MLVLRLRLQEALVLRRNLKIVFFVLSCNRACRVRG